MKYEFRDLQSHEGETHGVKINWDARHATKQYLGYTVYSICSILKRTRQTGANAICNALCVQNAYKMTKTVVTFDKPMKSGNMR